MRHIVRAIILVHLSFLSFFSAGARRTWTSADQIQVGEPKQGLQFRLSAGQEAAGEPAAMAAASVIGEPLSNQETDRILRRLPPFAPASRQKPVFPRAVVPPPRTGKTVLAAFPPQDHSSRPDIPPFEESGVTAFAPEGEVPLAPHLSVTFSQPMVAVTSLENLATVPSPVKLIPQPPGKWRWIGTRTILFEPAGRFPMATNYQVEVPAGTKSASGRAMAKSVTWSFSTPAPEIKEFSPATDWVSREAVLFAAFNQKIDPAAVLKTIKLQSSGTAIACHLATADEIKSDDTLSDLSKAAGEGRWVAFKSESLLPADSEIEVVVGPGVPSMEGPRTSAKAASWKFKTYGPMKVQKTMCGWSGSCMPLSPWFVEFTNPVDVKKFQNSMIRVTPDRADCRFSVNERLLSIEGQSKARTRYRVILSASIPDIFGQTLGRDIELTFTTAAMREGLAARGEPLVILDPAAPPRFPVYTVNHSLLKVRMFKVEPSMWNAFLRCLEAKRKDEPNVEPPGQLVFSNTLEVKNLPDEPVETLIDLLPALQNRLGQIILTVEPPTSPKPGARQQTVWVWIQSTRIAVDAFVDGNVLMSQVTSLHDGSPVPNAEILLIPSSSSSRTGPDGIAEIPLPSYPVDIALARLGKDEVFVPRMTYWWSGDSLWQRNSRTAELRWFVFDDRKMYRPGEEVHIKGWLRSIGTDKAGDIGFVGKSVARKITWKLQDSEETKIAEGVVSASAFHSFDFSLKLPVGMNLGTAQLTLAASRIAGISDGIVYNHEIEVQEFRRPEYEVTIDVSAGPHFVGDSGTATVKATYYTGSGLSNAEVDWQVVSSPGHFAPPNRADFVFGSWSLWWTGGRSNQNDETNQEEFSSRTDAAGKHTLRINFDSVNPPLPSYVSISASVSDVNRQSWNRQVSMLVHPADRYVGLKSDRNFYQVGAPIHMDAILTDLDGNAVSGKPIVMLAERLEWMQEAGEWQEKAVDTQNCTVTSDAQAVRCTFQSKQGGRYRITADITDDRGRRNRSSMTMWVAGGRLPPSDRIKQEEVTLVPDKQQYRAGDTAEILVISPFAPAYGVLTLRRSGLVRTEYLSMPEPSQVLRVKLEESYTPNLHVQVDLSGATDRSDANGKMRNDPPKRPAFASGDLNLAIPPSGRTLSLQVTPESAVLAPGGQTSIDVLLKDNDANPVAGAEVAVVVVDESVLSLTGYRLPDPIATFYTERRNGVKDFYARSFLLLSRQDQIGSRAEYPTELLRALWASSPRSALEYLMLQSRGVNTSTSTLTTVVNTIPTRINLNALALFAPSISTDSRGKARVTFRLPDNLTRYRIMAVAAAGGNKFGSGESTITARLPLMVRPSPPRYLNFGDQFELPVIVQNQTNEALTVDVVVRAGNATLLEGAGRRVQIAANDRVEIRFPAETESSGIAEFQVGAVSGEFADANQFQVPVRMPATTEAFATYGQMDDGIVAQPIVVPGNVLRQFGGLEVSTSSTAIQSLTDAVLFLTTYPFECTEQIASRILAIASLRDVLAAFSAPGLPDAKILIVSVEKDIQRLSQLQNDDGGFGFWRRDGPAWPYLGIHVAHALERARSKGFKVPEDMLDNSMEYLRDIEDNIPAWYSEGSKRALIAYALYVRKRLGDPDIDRARKLIRDTGLEKLSLEAVGWLLPVLSKDPGSAADVQAMRRLLVNRGEETAGAAHFTSSYSDGAQVLLHSDRRTDGILLEALIDDQPANAIIPKIVAGLLAHRTAGRWDNTQENAFILLALDRYFQTYEKATPDFTARIWLGEQYAGGHRFKGRAAEQQVLQIPMENLPEKSSDLVVSREGKGRLFYRIGMRYAPANLQLPPSDNGLFVERKYEAVDHPGDVSRDSAGVWHVKPGARVRIRLTMVAPARRYHVALVDPLPAGFEALNPELVVTGPLPDDLGDERDWRGENATRWRWYGPWYDRENLRDDRVEVFTPLLWEDVYTYTYYARASTPGTFVVPPAKAEEMYAPETFGRSATDKLIIK